MKKNIVNLLLFCAVLSFFITPVGFYSKLYLQRIFASSVEILPQKTHKISYNWNLKDDENRVFSFEQSQNHPVIVYFWASWNEKSLADLSGMYTLYNEYKDQVDFYFITNEEVLPVKQMMQRDDYHFPVSYIISEDTPSPFDTKIVPSGYIIDKNGYTRAKGKGVSRWNSENVRTLIKNITLE